LNFWTASKRYAIYTFKGIFLVKKSWLRAADFEIWTMLLFLRHQLNFQQKFNFLGLTAGENSVLNRFQWKKCIFRMYSKNRILKLYPKYQIWWGTVISYILKVLTSCPQNFFVLNFWRSYVKYPKLNFFSKDLQKHSKILVLESENRDFGIAIQGTQSHFFKLPCTKS
jgi:hypothetical protein